MKTKGRISIVGFAGVAALALALALFAAPVQAQTAGTHVKFGESDFIPMVNILDTPLVAADFIRADLGTVGDPNDDIVYYNSGAGAAVAKDDVRLVTAGTRTGEPG